ncbi:hypothetical protein OD90_0666 [Dokdonia sp. Hel_I_53]|nr:hypothetical protein OD90_0666 [Dokdonia sp. Hel_I_53]
MNLEQLQNATALYYQSFKTNKFTIPKKDTLAFMLFAKRARITFGPYQDITFYEISNRIYSDLVLLETARLLFGKFHVKSVKLKLSNHAGDDIAVIDKDNKVIIGEAFNTAPTYFQQKMRSDLRKFSDNKKGIIAFNKTALLGHENWFQGKKSQFPNITFILCEDENINSLTNGL